MAALLDTIQAERAAAQATVDAAQRRVDVLDRMRTLALQLDGVGEGADNGTSPPVPVAAPATPAVLSEPVPAAAVGALPRAVERATGGEAGETGPNPGRNGADAPDKPSAPGGAPGTTSGSGPSPAHQPTPRPTSPDLAPAILAALRDYGPSTYAQIAEHADLVQSSVEGRVRTLVDAGQVVCVGTGERQNGTNGRRPKLYAIHTGSAPVPHLRDVLECIAQGAGLIDEPEAAAQLDLDTHQVEAVTGELLERGLIERHFDGTYEASAEGHAQLAGGGPS